jgi:hypothetical protein
VVGIDRLLDLAPAGRVAGILEPAPDTRVDDEDGAA